MEAPTINVHLSCHFC